MIRSIIEKYARFGYAAQKHFNQKFGIEEGLNDLGVNAYLNKKLPTSAPEYFSNDSSSLSFHTRDSNSEHDDIHSAVHATLTACYAKRFGDFYSRYFSPLNKNDIKLAMAMAASHDIARVDGCPDHDEYRNAFYLALILRDAHNLPQERAVDIAEHVARKDAKDLTQKSIFSRLVQCADCVAISRVHSIKFDPIFLNAHQDLMQIDDPKKRAEAAAELKSIVDHITSFERSARADALYSPHTKLTSFEATLEAIENRAKKLGDSAEKKDFIETLTGLDDVKITLSPDASCDVLSGKTLDLAGARQGR